MKILHICNSRVYGGGEEHVRTILKYLKREGVDVCAAVVPDSGLSVVLGQETIPVYPFFISNKFDFKSFFKLCRLIKRESISLLHTHNRQEDLIGALAGFVTGIPVVTTIHDRINMDQNGKKVRNIQSAVYHFILRNLFSKLITVSKATCDDLREFAKVSDEKMVHIVNGLDLDRVKGECNPKLTKQSIGIGSDKKVVGFVARIRGESFGKKGIIHLIEASQRIIKKVEDVVFVVSGEDEKASRILTKVCDEKNVGDYFRFIGYRDDIVEVMRLFDLLVCPSLFEGLPRVVLESMAIGVPVVGSDVDGLPEVIEDGLTGYLVPPADSDAIADKVVKLLKDDELRKKFSKNSVAKIEKFFRAEISALRTVEVYKTLLRGTN